MSATRRARTPAIPRVPVQQAARPSQGEPLVASDKEKAAVARAALRATASGPERDLAGLRVLVVEDEALIAMELEGVLEGLGVVVVGTASSAEEAVSMAEALRPDCITMDVRLVGSRDGVDAAREIFERYAIRSVFVTAYPESSLIERGKAANPLGWVQKPFTARTLATALKVLPPS